MTALVDLTVERWRRRGGWPALELELTEVPGEELDEEDAGSAIAATPAVQLALFDGEEAGDGEGR